ncbi:MAG TPA: J domain-containing protein, partial [Duganella sp.]|nr:J domain-containing protein [Duganella sp.]
MGKIHTHYDNLKVSRMAPQEVIRAAYKALSQKYHPDKNPGDEKAARIMAILNSAYDTLSDTQRRREHDEWIAAEEWEIEWLESTRGEDRGERP